MKNIFFLLFFFNFNIGFSQIANFQSNNAIKGTRITCENGIEQAIKDFNAGIYNCFTYGYVYDVNPDLNSFIQKYTKDKYGIDTKNVGCIVSEYSKCYQKRMNEMVLNKFGNDIFEKTKKEAEILFIKK